jgi:hypothetical protein
MKERNKEEKCRTSFSIQLEPELLDQHTQHYNSATHGLSIPLAPQLNVQWGLQTTVI